MARLAEMTPKGAFVEIGVYQGGSSQTLYHLGIKQGRAVYLYDTFSGIPYAGEHDSHKPGDFADGISEHELRSLLPQAIVQKVVFPGDAEVPGRIAFAHLDVDQEQSYADAMRTLMPRMVRGGMVLCDDYCLAGAARAIDAIDGEKCVKAALRDGRMLLLC